MEERDGDWGASSGTEFLWKINQLQHDDLRFADAKANSIVSAAVGIIAAILAVLVAKKIPFQEWVCCCCFHGMFAIFSSVAAFVAMTLAFKVVAPRKSMISLDSEDDGGKGVSPPDTNLLYWKNIKGFGCPSRFIDALGIKEKSVEHVQIALDAIMSARVLEKKYKWIAMALWSLFISLVLGLMFISSVFLWG